jgi:hypothetical protein
MLPIFEKFEFLYKPYVLAILTIGYISAELGHYLVGVTSKATAIELNYGDHACQLNNSDYLRHELPMQCSDIPSSDE